MQTKYNIGQIVLLKVEVAEINITDSGVIYSILMTGKRNAIKVPEEDIECASKETDDGD